MILLIVVFGAVMFGLGYVLGDDNGWSRCWKSLTKDDAWREDDAA